MSGAGAAMISIPAYLLLGYPISAGLTASQITGVLWTPLAAFNYMRNKKLDLALIAGLVISGLCGAVIGTLFVLNVPSENLQKLFGVIILLLVAFVASNRQFGLSSSTENLGRTPTSLLALPLGFYEAIFGSGNGLFTSSILIKARGFDLPTALGYYYAISFFWCLLSSSVYCYNGLADLSLILPASLGSVLGGWTGSRVGSLKGSQFVRTLFIVLGSVLGLRLCF